MFERNIGKFVEMVLHSKVHNSNVSNMEYIVLVFICVLVLAVKGVPENNLHFSERVVISDTYNTEPLVRRMIRDATIQRCILECKARTYCDYINYYIHAHLCYIIQAIPATMTVTSDPRFVYASRTEFSEVCIVNSC